MTSIDFVVSAQNADGGWGYKQGGMSFVEPTAAVLLALRPGGARTPNVDRGVNFLRQLQRADGGWGIAKLDDESGWMTAWAVWALAGVDAGAADRGSVWLLKTEGLRVTNPTDLEGIRRLLHIDASLRGWPWLPGDANWVFPTALSLQALNALGLGSHSRCQQAVDFLIDRGVSSGGWNIGNPMMLNADLPATILCTSIALTALGSAHISHPAVSRGIKWLQQRIVQAHSAADLAWGAWALRESGADAGDVPTRLRAIQRADGSWNGNPLTTAVAMMALS